jgi:hypothetical protein
MHFNVTAGGKKSKKTASSNQQGLGSSEELPSVSIGSPKIWSQLRSNKTSVYLHVLVLKAKNSHEGIDDIEEVGSGMIQRGEALYGIVKMVKYDKIPKHFRHRYLLSDFGLVNMTALEGEV